MKSSLWLATAIVLISSCATSHRARCTASIESSIEHSLPGAPVLNSPEDIRDYNSLVSFQQHRTAEDCTRGASEVKINLANFYGPPYGPLSAEEVAEWAPAFEKMSNLAWPLVGMAKKKWERPRPYLSHNDLSPCVKRETSFSYPSGHASISHYYMHILETIYPDRKQAIDARAEQIALDRNIVGVHYPSDVRDGKLLGDKIYEGLVDTSDFQEALKTAPAARN